VPLGLGVLAPGRVILLAVSITGPTGAPAGLEGGWRVQVTIETGPFTGSQQYLMVYSAGGGMIESSNFDSAPPVPPAYGSWLASGESSFRSTYVFFTTEPVDQLDAAAGWDFSGSGKFRESITLSSSGNDYTSRLSYELYDTADKPLAGQSGEGYSVGRRIVVEF
jgi:hypothetical protein